MSTTWSTIVCAVTGHKWQHRMSGDLCARCQAFHSHASQYSTTMHWDGDGWHAGR